MEKINCKRRVVVTGYSMITALGNDAETSWERMIKGESGVGRITRFDTEGYTTKIAGEVKGFDPEKFIEKKEVKKMDQFIHYAVAASKMALDMSGLQINDANAHKIGVWIGAGIGGLMTIEKYHTMLLESGPKKISPFFIPMLLINLAPGQVSIMTGAKGPNASTVSACSTGTNSIGDAYKIIARGDADAMIAGGAESTISPLCISGFNAMKALSTRNDEPDKASRPFDKQRDGFVVSEGAGILILEEMNSALERGAKIYAEIVGYGVSSDAYHLSTPDPEAKGAYYSMKNAIEDGGINPADLDYVNAHGTSTYYNDLNETKAIKQLFGDKAYKLKISSIKSMIGHSLGAAGGIEAVATVLTVKTGIIPPTINLEERDEECDLDYVPNTAQKGDIKFAISNSFGFGGTNATLVFKKWEG
ncbi:MAG: beta-ketoacyl-[acyl-carrier-protein] synthase II [Candidatus Acidulodesulfobacterium acidiphilum]|jgi:3-oxoacyl-[acyl-carrier-protein] synthase II|uniref:3-oxoacyl-[acyl-carrier-protein] synthase 2 n=1 Tax=Candidatus Acidulodesulfobacterium acidiphilum TaxID=2597224 RepID=A0A520XGN4_9DELT|nr:MAG: beta-ketoacyl-[acyl-carrier-protein] synthase II [Candidatus Acidulodesulfobacterium acidiphilum]